MPADSPMVLVPQTAEDVKARFGLDPDATGNRPRGWRIVDESESSDIRAFNGTDIPAGSLAVHTRDGASNPICAEACRLPNFIGTVEDDFDRTYRDYFYAPLPPAPSTTSTAEQVGASEASAPNPFGTGLSEPRMSAPDMEAVAASLKPFAPSPGEGDAPVAWRVEDERDRAAQAVCGANAIMGREPLSEGASYTLADAVIREITRPTPATPEGLREAEPATNDPLREFIKRVMVWRLADYDRTSIKGAMALTVHQIDVFRHELDAILAALQPQAEGE